MNQPRRKFLKAGTTAGLALIFSRADQFVALAQQNHQLGTGIGSPLPNTIHRDPLYNLRRKQFTENLNTRFGVLEDGAYMGDLTLISVQLLNPPYVPNNPSSPRECFALVFRGPAGLALGQGTYLVQHNTLGNFELFIVPGSTDAEGGPHYEALINRVDP